MTKTNRSHRIAYLVLLLVVAVALTTALVLAGERKSLPTNRTPSTTNSVAAGEL